MVGNGTTTFSAIDIRARKNVSIHHCEFEDFFTEGVSFNGLVSGIGDPTTPATGNSFHDNIVINCADYEGAGESGNGRGNLCIGGQTDMLVENSTITQTDRGTDSNGYGIKFTGTGYLRGLKIQNCTITVPPYDGSAFDFAIELWSIRGGLEIDHCVIQGAIDIGSSSNEGAISGNDEAGYGFAAKIHDNTIGQSTLNTLNENGITPEQNITGGFHIYKNLFKNLSNPIQFSLGNSNILEDVYVYNNIFREIGVAGAHAGNYGICIGIGDIGGGTGTNVTFDNINILNNTMYAGSTPTDPNAGIRWGPGIGGTVTNVVVKNNIIQGFIDLRCIYWSGGTWNTVSIENNDLYGNGGIANEIDINNGGISITNLTNQNNKTTIPGFVTPGTDFHLAVGSGNINAGINVGLSTDYSSHRVPYNNGLPDIGAYEWGTRYLKISKKLQSQIGKLVVITQ